jgi:hypothetical protein
MALPLPTDNDILTDPTFARATASHPTSAALFHTLSGRVQHLMNRVGGNSLHGRLQQYIQGIQVEFRSLKLHHLVSHC